MGWEDWLRDIKKLDEIQEFATASQYDDALHAWAHNTIMYWYGKVKADRTYIPEGADDIIVEIIKKAKSQRLVIDNSHWEIIFALLCGILQSQPLDPMEAMIQAVHIGAALKEMPNV